MFNKFSITQFSKLRTISLVMFLLFAICYMLLAVSRANAESFGVSVTPLIREITAKPGETIKGTVDVTGSNASTQTLYPLARDFAPNNDPASSTPKFYESTPDDYSYALSKWVSFGKQSLEIASKKTESMEYTISIPSDAEPGGHYGAIFVTSQAPDPTGKTEVAVDARVGSLILLTVSGDLQSQGEVVTFAPSKKLYAKPPATLNTLLKNTGNVHLKPSGEIEITGWGGAQEKLTFNKEGGNVLPQSQRQFSNETKTLSWGRYLAQANLELLSPNGDKFPLTAVASFWIVPIIPIVIVLVILLVIIFLWRKWLKRHDQALKQELKN